MEQRRKNDLRLELAGIHEFCMGALLAMSSSPNHPHYIALNFV